MKLVTFAPKGFWEQRIGVLTDDEKRIMDLNAGYTLYLAEVEKEPRSVAVAKALMPSDMIEFLEGEQSTIKRAKITLDYVKKRSSEERQKLTDPAGRRILYEMRDATLKSPIPRPPGIGIGYFNEPGIIEEAARVAQKERGLQIEIVYPKKAAILWGHPGCVIGPDEPIIYPKICAERGPRVFNGIELGIVVGKKAYQVPLEKAKQYIAGYTVTSDITAYDLVAEEPAQFTLTRAKDMPTFWPIGPCITLADQIKDPNNLECIVRINGKVAMTANTKRYTFDPFDYIRDLSEYMILEPGTIIAMGSFCETTFTFIKPGDIVENEIEGIGILRNPVIAEK